MEQKQETESKEQLIAEIGVRVHELYDRRRQRTAPELQKLEDETRISLRTLLDTYGMEGCILMLSKEFNVDPQQLDKTILKGARYETTQSATEATVQQWYERGVEKETRQKYDKNPVERKEFIKFHLTKEGERAIYEIRNSLERMVTKDWRGEVTPTTIIDPEEILFNASLYLTDSKLLKDPSLN